MERNIHLLLKRRLMQIASVAIFLFPFCEIYFSIFFLNEENAPKKSIVGSTKRDL